MYEWDVVPLCEAQLRDVNKEDILCNGLYRRCNIYKGGGGYDKFSDIYKLKNNISDRDFNMQFVVQLRGCPLRCPYCYVTPDGVFGNSVSVSTDKLVSDFMDSGLDVFHLMGGAPALYIDYWCEILDRLSSGIPFHSDLLLVEKEYDNDVLLKLSNFKNGLYAVSIKGANADEFHQNTGVVLNEDLFWCNLRKLIMYNIPFYMTFTGMSDDSISNFKMKIEERYPLLYNEIVMYSFSIGLIEYDALK